MERASSIKFRAANLVADLFVFLSSYSLGLLFWCYAYLGEIQIDFLQSLTPATVLTPFLIFYGIGFFVLAWSRIYHSSRLRPFSSCVLVYLRTVAIAIMGLSLCSVLFPEVVTSRSLLVGSAIFTVLGLSLKEYSLRFWLSTLRSRGLSQQRAIVIGHDPELMAKLIAECERDFLLGISLVGTIAPGKLPSNLSNTQLRVLGEVSQLESILKDYHPDIVIFFAHELGSQELREYLWMCEERGLQVWLKLDLLDRIIYQATINSISGVAFLSFHGTSHNPMELLIKEIFDRVASFLLLMLFSPLLLLIAVLIKFSSPGPILFRQVRSGLNGKRFEVLKFRSMVVEAEVLKEQLKSSNEMSGPVFKIKKDPRVTKLGRILRRTSLDELPQLWNVFRGDMSLVGPRPMDIKEVERIEGWHRRRLTMKPGITCIWQTAGRNQISNFDDWAKLDLQYIDNWNLWLDFVLLAKTIPVVLFGRGAS